MSDTKEEKKKKGEGKKKWKCKKHKIAKHDVFINYRVATDKALAEKIALALSAETREDGKHFRPFLDVECLNDGEEWEAGFLNGLEHAAVILLLISEDGIKRIEGAHERQDNVLLEYEYALDKHEKGTAVLLPLMVGKNVEGGLYKAFGAYGVSQYSEAKHASPKSTGKSVRGTMETLFKIQGIATNPDGFRDRVKDIVGFVTEALKKYGRMGEAKTGETYKEKYCSDWTLADVQSYLKDEGLGAYGEKFKEGAITGPDFLDLDEKTLKEDLGVTKNLHLKKLLKYIKTQKKAEAEEDDEEEEEEEGGDDEGGEEGEGDGEEGGEEE